MHENSGLRSYFNSLNLKDKSKMLTYGEILDFMPEHFIPAVSMEVAFFLSWISGLIRPKSILEIGFGSGISSVFMMTGAGNDALAISLEKDKNRYERGLALLPARNISNIKLIRQDAFDFLRNDNGHYDLIFLDAVKKDYHDYLDLLVPRLNAGGVLICDNVLYEGKVLSSDAKNGIQKMRDFNKRLSEISELDTYFINIGDGLSLSVKSRIARSD